MRVRVTVAVLLALGMLLVAPPALAGVYPPGSTVAGKTLGQWKSTASRFEADIWSEGELECRPYKEMSQWILRRFGFQRRLTRGVRLCNKALT